MKEVYKVKNIDTNKIEQAARMILEALGDDVEREGLKETPKRVAKMFDEVYEGMKYTNEELATMYGKCFEENTKDMVLIKDIETFSHCEHHMALMYDMNISVAYIPNGKVIGLSKVARIADMVCKRLQIQERIGKDIADILQAILGTEDVAVIVNGKHACMTTRGIKKTNSTTTTSVLRGKFLIDPSLRQELMSVQ